jgi:hypothetical protein
MSTGVRIVASHSLASNQNTCCRCDWQSKRETIGVQNCAIDEGTIGFLLFSLCVFPPNKCRKKLNLAIRDAASKMTYKEMTVAFAKYDVWYTKVRMPRQFRAYK